MTGMNEIKWTSSPKISTVMEIDVADRSAVG